jgi:hypothetical protein
VNAGRFLAEHPSSHVEVMDHHVAEQTARLRDILKWGRKRIAACNRQLFKVADLAVSIAFPA